MANIYFTFAVIFVMIVTIMGSEDTQRSLSRYYEEKQSSELITDLVDYILGYSGESQGRTFGVKRIQFMLMPMVFKMGVMMTMLIVVAILSLKGLMIGVALLILKLSSIFGKFYAAAHTPAVGYAPPPQPVHLHVYGQHQGAHHAPPPPPPPHYSSHYSPWEHTSSPEDEHYYYKG